MKKAVDVRKWAINISLLLLSTAAAILLMEVVLRVVYRGIPGVTMPHAHNRYYYTADEDAGFDIAPNRPPELFILCDPPHHEIWSNELGCFDEPYKGEKEYILLLGDSFTWGFTPFEKKWGTLLEESLNMRVLKCGVSGYGTRHEIMKARKIVNAVDVLPKLIVVGYYWGNDVLDDWAFPQETIIDGYRLTKTDIDATTGKKTTYTDGELRRQLDNWEKYGVPYVPRYPLVQKLKRFLDRHSLIYPPIYRTVLKPLVNRVVMDWGFMKETALRTGIITEFDTLEATTLGKHPWIKEAWREHLLNIKEMKELADGYGVRLLFVIIPTKEQVYDFLHGRAEEDYSKPLREFLEKENIEPLDLLPLFRSHADLRPRKRLNSEADLYESSGVHWNINGNRLAAGLVSEYILERKMSE